MKKSLKKDSLYEETIPVFIKFLSNLSTILGKGARSKVAEKKLIGGKLAPDMYNLTQQVGYAYFMALEATTNLSGKQGPELGYDETSIKELRASLRRVTAFLRTVKAKDFSQREGKRMKSFLLGEKQSVSRETYVRELAMPNFFFHVTTAYGILRHLGVPLKKDDYLGVVKK